MPRITDKNGKPSNFTDTNVRGLTADKTTWFTDPAAKGLRLCVTKSGVKTWYVNKWDPTSGKTRSVKLAQWASTGTHCAWAKKQVGEVTQQIVTGAVRNRQEQVEDRVGIPTLREAFEMEVDRRLNLDDAYGGPRSAETMQNYRAAIDNYLGDLADALVTEIDHMTIQRRLDDCAKEHPYAAHKLNIALSFAFKRAKRVLRVERFDFLWPSLEQNPRMGKRKVDYNVPWADRFGEIVDVENEHKRLCWLIRWYTGQRERMLRTLRWTDIDLTEGTMLVHSGLKHEKEPRLIAMSDQVKAWFERLHEIRLHDCDWVFPSRRIVGDERGHLDALDRLPLTAPGELRHLWNEATHEVECREMVLRWLCGQKLTAGETKNLGLYGTVPVERQRKVANEIASVISSRIGVENTLIEAAPFSVIELKRNATYV